MNLTCMQKAQTYQFSIITDNRQTPELGIKQNPEFRITKQLYVSILSTITYVY